MRLQPAETTAALVAMVATTCKAVDAKRTLSTAEELTYCVDMILEQHPTLTLQELKLCCEGIINGTLTDFNGKPVKLYERLKVSEFLECFRYYEGGERTRMLEHINRAPVTRGADNPHLNQFQPQSMADLIRKRNPYISGAIAREEAGKE